MQLTLTRPHPGKFWKPLPFTGFSRESLTWLKRHFCHRRALWLPPTNISGGSFSLLEGPGQMIWKFPSNTHVLWVYDFTKDAQILGGAKPLGPLANSSVYWPLLGFFIGFVFPLRVFLSFHISTFLWLLSAAALRCPYMYSPTYAPTHTSKAASFSGCFWVGLASLTGPGMSHLAPSYPRALCTD